MTAKSIKPAIWLLAFIAILPQFSETVYTPALPDIARSLHVKEAMVEYTLSIYLFGLAIGVLFWGRLSDALGRRPCLLCGVLMFILGCIGCFFSTSIEALLISRFVQAFGGSTGSVLGQSIARDAFKGPERGRVFSLIGSAFSLGPAIGPVVGGLIDETLGWSFIFLFLALFGAFVFYISHKNLGETRHPTTSQKKDAGSLLTIFFSMLRNKHIITCSLLMGGIIGILFSYYSEGSFYLIDILGLSPKVYGITFISLAISGASGSLWSRHLHSSMGTLKIMERGLTLFIIGTSLFFCLTLLLSLCAAPSFWFIALTVMTMMILTFSASLILPNIISIAIIDYEHVTGTASSFFGFFYFTIVSLITFFMGALHNGTLLPMPIYFFLISILVYFIFVRYLKEK